MGRWLAAGESSGGPVLRRSFLQLFASGVLFALLGKPGRAASPADLYTFRHGVASGDPLQDAVILWTRISNADGESLTVDWQVARNQAMTDIVASGVVTTDANRDYTVKGRITPVSSGEITADVRGRWQGPFRARFEARRLTSVLFRQLSKAWPRWRGASVPPRGTAADLGSLMIDTLGGTLQDQLEALRLAPERADAHLLIARVTLASGDVAQAERHTQEALRLAPDDEGAVALLLGLRARQSWILGLWWRSAREMDRRPMTWFFALLVVLLGARTGIALAGLPHLNEVVSYIVLGFAAYVAGAGAWFRHALHRARRGVALEDY